MLGLQQRKMVSPSPDHRLSNLWEVREIMDQQLLCFGGDKVGAQKQTEAPDLRAV